MKLWSDETMMILIRKGSGRALARLVSRHKDGLLGFIYSVVRDRHLAEDIFQETFLRVWRQAFRFDPGRRFKTWLYAIALNLCRDELKKSRRHRHLSLEAAGNQGEEGFRPLDWIEDAKPGPPETAWERELERVLRSKLDRLAPPHREVVLMSRLLGLKSEEIAEILGVPPGTVRSRLHYALIELRSEFKEYFPGLTRGRSEQR